MSSEVIDANIEIYDYEILLSLTFHILCFIAQSLVILHFYVKIRKPSRKISKLIKYTALIVIIFAWISILYDVIAGIFDIFIIDMLLSSMKEYCYTMYYLRFIRIILFEIILSSFWMIRLNHTFKFSALEIKFKVFVILFSIILLLSLLLSILFIVIFNQLSITEIYFIQITSSFNINLGGTCYINWSFAVLLLVTGSQLLTLTQNICLAIIFWIKLRSLHRIVSSTGDLSGQAGQRLSRIFKLQQKHTLLATVPIICTIIIWILFDSINYLQISISSLYFVTNIDMIIKCISMILFFKFYERRFGQFCCFCLKCIGTTNEGLFPYFNSKQEFRKDNKTIYDKVEKIKRRKTLLKEQKKNAKKRKQSLQVMKQQIDINNDNGMDINNGLPKLVIDIYADSDEDDEYNEDASRSYHEPDELFKHLSMPPNVHLNKPKHILVDSFEMDLTDDEKTNPIKKTYSARDITPDDIVDPIQKWRANDWMQKVLAIEIDPNLKMETLEQQKKQQLNSPSDLVAARDKAFSITSILTNEEEEGFFGKLRDGVILCDLLNAIKPGTVPPLYKPTTIAFVKRANINMFIEGCKKLGLRDIDIFDTNDLFENKRLSRVIKCIYAISAISKSKKINYNGPTIGYKYAEYNPRTFSQATLNKSKLYYNKGSIQMTQRKIDAYGPVKILQ